MSERFRPPVILGNYRSRETKGTQCFVYRTTIVTTARSNDVATRRISLGRDLTCPKQRVTLSNCTNKVVAE
jgi:hypothetical protein